ncbi:MAG: MerR family DNA-binding transcriptional regulator [Terriglobia bacterium]
MKKTGMFTRLSSNDVAGVLGISKKTLKNWLRAGKIPEPQRDPNNNYRVWTLQDVENIRKTMEEKR